MYVEFNEQLINSIYFGKVEKVDLNDSGSITYCLEYELINGMKYLKEYNSEQERVAEYETLKSDG